MAWPQPPAFSPDTYPAVSLPRLSTLHRNLALDLSSAVGLGTTMAVVSVLLPSVARREGLDAMGLAGLAALPFVASLLTLFAGRVGPRSPARLALLRSVGALGLLLVLVAPHPLLIAAATLAFWTSFALGAPLQQRIWATLYPTADRGRLRGVVGTGRFTARTVALLAITVEASTSGWVPVVAILAGVGAISSLAIGRMEVPGIEAGQSFSAQGSLRAVIGVPMVRRMAGAQLLFGAGVMAAPALIAMVHVDRLALGLDDIALAGLISYGSTAATIGLWGRLAGRFGALHTIAIGTLMGAAGLGLLAVAPSFTLVIAATLLLGTSNAAVNAAWPLLIADHAEDQAAAAAGLNSIMGLRGMVAPFIVMAPVSAGYVDETGGLLLCLALSGAGALLYGRLAGVVRLPDGSGEWLRAFEVRAALLAEPQLRPAMVPSWPSSISGWPLSFRNRFTRSTMAGWVLNRPRALCSSFLTGLTK